MRFRAAPFFAMLGLLTGIHVLPYILVWFAPYTKPAAAAIALNLLLRLVLALGYGHPILTSVLLHPFAIVLFLMIGLNSYRWHKTGKMRWKGRAFSTHAFRSERSS